MIKVNTANTNIIKINQCVCLEWKFKWKWVFWYWYCNICQLPRCVVHSKPIVFVVLIVEWWRKWGRTQLNMHKNKKSHGITENNRKQMTNVQMRGIYETGRLKCVILHELGFKVCYMVAYSLNSIQFNRHAFLNEAVNNSIKHILHLLKEAFHIETFKNK